VLNVEVLDRSRIADLDELFACDRSVDRCWCMWFIIRVNDYQAAGHDGNRTSFIELVEEGPPPMGLIAYDDGKPVGWCAAGPRARYARAAKTPTLKSRNPAEKEDVWLIPCFFIRPGWREQGVAGALLEAAVELAAEQGALAIEGFPLAGDKRRSSGSDLQTGVERLFAGAGFEAVARPSSNRVIMRRQLDG
jgi:GNAT superfamily N-acetyltransferase